MNKNNIKVLFQGQYLEINDEENIVLKRQIKDVKDASKIFTDHSYNFSIPASKTNNDVLKHCLRTDIGSFDDGDSIDPRGYYDATIEINGEVYTEGYLEIIEAMVESGRVHTYRLRFIGRLAKLSRALEDAKLIDLAAYFGKYNFPTRASVWYDLLVTDEATDLPNTDESYWDEFDSTAVNDNVRVFLNNITDQQLKFNDRTSFTEEQVQDTEELGSDTANIAYTTWTTAANSSDDDTYDEERRTRKGIDFNGFRVDLLRPSLRETAVLEAIEDAFQGEVDLKFSRGLDSNGFPTSDDSSVDTGKEHFFGSEEFKASWMLLYAKNGGNKNRRQLFFENNWGPLTSNAFKFDSSDGSARGLLQWCNIDADDATNVAPYVSLYYRGEDAWTDLYAELDITATPTNVPYKLTIEMGGEILKTYDQTSGGNLTKNSPTTVNGHGDNTRTVKGDRILKGQDATFAFGCQGINVFVESEDEVEIGGTINFQLLWKYSNWLNRKYYNKGNFENTISSLKSSTENFTVDTNLPDISLIDILKGWQKTYNLVYYIDRDADNKEVIVAEEYDKYIDTSSNGYSGAEIIDITPYVNTESYAIGKPTYYTEVDMGYSGRETFLIKEYDNSRVFPYGTEQYEQRLALTNLTPRSKYKIEVPFELILLNSRTNSNQSATDTTSVMFPYAWLVDNSRSQTDLGYFRHYASNESVGTSSDGLLAKDKDNNAFDEITSCNLPQLRRYDSSDNMVQSLLFSVNSDDSYTLEADTSESPSLFNTYYKTFIENSFNKYAKMHRFEAYLDRALLAKLSLNDTLIVGNDSYRINSYEVELGSGKAKMELISTNKPQLKQSFKASVDDGTIKNTIDIEEFYVTGGARKGETDDFVFNIVADGGADTLTYKWYKNDTEVTGETGKTYTLTAANAADGDEVYCEVSDGTFTKDSSIITIAIVTNTFTSITPSKTTLAAAGETITLTVVGPASTGFEILTKDSSPSGWINRYQLNNGTYGNDIATDAALATSGIEASANMKIIDSPNHIEIQTVWDETVFNSVFDATTTAGYYIKNTDEDYASDEEILYVPSTDDGGSWEQDEDGEVDTITWGTNKHIPTWLANLAFEKVIDGNTVTYYYNTTTWTETKEVQTITIGGTNANVIVGGTNEIMRLHLPAAFEGGRVDADPADGVYEWGTSTVSAASSFNNKYLRGVNIQGFIMELPASVATEEQISTGDSWESLWESWANQYANGTKQVTTITVGGSYTQGDIDSVYRFTFTDEDDSTTATADVGIDIIGQVFTATEMATRIANDINNDTDVFVSATSSGAVVTVTWDNPGTVTANSGTGISYVSYDTNAPDLTIATSTAGGTGAASGYSWDDTDNRLTIPYSQDNALSGVTSINTNISFITYDSATAAPGSSGGGKRTQGYANSSNIFSVVTEMGVDDPTSITIDPDTGNTVYTTSLSDFKATDAESPASYLDRIGDAVAALETNITYNGTVNDGTELVGPVYGASNYDGDGDVSGNAWAIFTSDDATTRKTAAATDDISDLENNFIVAGSTTWTNNFANDDVVRLIIGNCEADVTLTEEGFKGVANQLVSTGGYGFKITNVENVSGTFGTAIGTTNVSGFSASMEKEVPSKYIDIDMGTTTAIEHSATLTIGSGSNGEIEVDGMNATDGTGMHTTITVYDYSNTEVTSFTQSSSSLTDDKSGDVVTAIKDAINDNEETPIDFGATESGKVVTATADENGYIDGKWSVTINNHNQSTNPGTLTATVATTTEGSDSGDIELAKRTVVGTTGTTDADGNATVSLYVGPNSGDADRTFKVELINQDLYSDTVESATITQNDPD